MLRALGSHQEGGVCREEGEGALVCLDKPDLPGSQKALLPLPRPGSR